jgi:RNase P subunit RPR2
VIQAVICKCTEVIVKSENGVSKIRSKITLIKADGIVVAVCKSCGMENELPLKAASPAGPPLILSK